MAALDTTRHRALADPRRARIVAELEAAPGGLGVSELAGRVGLHANTVRWHLGVLADAGLVVSAAEARSVPGRPRILYRAGSHESEGEPGREEYRLLANVLAATIAGRGDAAEACTEAGRTWGESLVAGRPPGREEAIAAVVEILDEQGFEPAAEGNEIAMRRCPFHDLAEAHPEVVCAVHQGLIDGALARLGSGLAVSELQVSPTPDVCLARLAPVRAD
jgi:predicted ArsR family transcriptional regulator